MAEVDINLNTLSDKLKTTKVSTRHYKTTRATSDQEKRRKVSLANQRCKRSDLFDLRRQIEPLLKIEHEYTLMWSEWFQDVPQDFDTLWRMIICPNGKRSLIIAKSGVTKVYSRKGVLVNTFQSGLPGGNRSCYSGVTVLDAIFCRDQRTYFLLDIMTWNGHTLIECETEFRFYFLRAKLEETMELTELSSTNQFIFTLLMNYPCQQDTLCAIMSHSVPYGIDGLLFYHLQGHYTPGETPLVLWMTPNMSPDSIG
ncbi:Snurportin-1 [Oopsacas minuta]|uniref:Snurportin-1 n=1 Tax=Oopsacas minuta TaxID=111878 RepID=A0AAV7K6H0_9METZ|nr:Snurportin-1 [Oopsacas minuta]